MSENSVIEMRRRLGIFYFHDKNGVVDRYVDVLLRAMKDYLNDLYIVVGGCLNAKGRKVFNEYTDIVIVDEKVKSCMEGYRRAFKCFGKDLLSEFDELLFFDSSLIGPFYDLDEMFQYMDNLKIDFWSLMDQYHVASYRSPGFIAIRKRILKSIDFEKLWCKKDIDGIVQYFCDHGYEWKAYIDADELKYLNEDIMLYYPRELLEKYHCPFLRMDIFTTDYKCLINESLGQSLKDLVSYVDNSKIYDINLLWDYLLRVCHQSDIVRNMHLTYILPEKNNNKIIEDCRNRKIALLIHIYRVDMAKILAEYALNMPESADILVTTDTEQKKNIIKDIFENEGIRRLKIRVIENRGRDVGSKLVGVKDVILDYDYVCCIHDKKTPHLQPKSIGDSFGYKCFRNIIPSSDYVENVIQLFEHNPRMGIAVPPEPNHAAFFTTLGLEWVGNYKNTEELARMLELNVPISQEKEPVAPFGSFFWFRPVAMKKLYDYDWKYSDFPEEPIEDDATILHAIERIYPFVVQDAGYYPAVIMSDQCARIEHTNLKYYVQCYNRILIEHGILNSHNIMCKELKDILNRQR